jgi:hypothetical protein
MTTPRAPDKNLPQKRAQVDGRIPKPLAFLHGPSVALTARTCAREADQVTTRARVRTRTGSARSGRSIVTRNEGARSARGAS